jgi:hypothetical protein
MNSNPEGYSAKPVEQNRCGFRPGHKFGEPGLDCVIRGQSVCDYASRSREEMGFCGNAVFRFPPNWHSRPRITTIDRADF